MILEDRLLRDLVVKNRLELRDLFILETVEGTRLVALSTVKQMMMNNIVYNTLNDMKNATLNEGDICITLGYKKIGDGGGGIYKIVYEPTAVEDGGQWHYLATSDVLRARLISIGQGITLEQYGAVGDGSEDDYNAIMKAFESGATIKFVPGKTYKISKALVLKNNIVYDFNGCVLKPTNANAIGIAANNPEISTLKNATIKNVTIDMSSAQTYHAISIDKPSEDCEIKNVNIINALTTPVKILVPANNLDIGDMSIKCTGTPTAAGIELYNKTGASKTYQRIHIHDTEFYNCGKCVYLNCIKDTTKLAVDNCECKLANRSASNSTVVQINNSGIRSVTIESILSRNIDYGFINAGIHFVSIRDCLMEECKDLYYNSNTDLCIEACNNNINNNTGGSGVGTPPTGTVAGGGSGGGASSAHTTDYSNPHRVTALQTGASPASSYVEYTMAASGWNKSAKTFSFEGIYPHSTHNIELYVNQSCNDAQLSAWGSAQIISNANSNIVKAFGEVPTIDIPVILKLTRKS